MASDCIFCKIVAGQIPAHRVHEDAATFAFLDIRPLTRGHALVVSKRHAAKLEELTGPEAQSVMATVHALVPRIGKAVDAPSTTIALHNGKEAGQEVPHLHFHLVPRRAGDGGGPIHALFSNRPQMEDGELAELARKIAR